MPRLIGQKFDPAATKALRHEMCRGTICCAVCKRPAAGIYQNIPLCEYHIRKKYGFIPVV